MLFKITCCVVMLNSPFMGPVLSYEEDGNEDGIKALG